MKTKIKTKGKYILKDKKVVPCYDLIKWARWIETKDRVVKQEDLKNGLFISTIFLGLDHNFLNIFVKKEAEPILFETMVFKPLEKGAKYKDSLDQARCSTWKEAEKMHKQIVTKWKDIKKEQYEKENKKNS